MSASPVIITGGTVISDRSVHEGVTIEIVGDRIMRVARDAEGAAQLPSGPLDLDARNCFVIPGIINGHAHGCTTGPLFSSAAAPLSKAQAIANLDRHLAAGVTTLVNVCGFANVEDVPEHAIDVRLGTTHLPAAVVAADIVDGAGLNPAHREMTAEQMLDSGAVALGEIGSGATLGGGVAAYRYVPDAVEEVLGYRLEPDVATALIDALVGPSRVAEPDDAALGAALASAGLPDSVRPAVREAILRYASAPVHASLDSFAEAAALSATYGRPAVFHVAAPSVERVLHLAQTTSAVIVAGHMNHPSIPTAEAVAWARRLRAAGAVIDVSSLDIVGARRLATPEIADALVKEGLVDTLSTDYAGGAWESMLGLVQYWREAGLVALEDGIAMCTSTPADVFGMPDRGRIEEGMRADVVLVSKDDVSQVQAVVIGGEVVDLRPA